jgi:tetratricopeptide (TPR) repeat protein
MKIEDIQDNFRIRTEVSVILSTGQQFSGTLVGISESSVTLRPSSGGKMLLDAAAINCILPAETTELSSQETHIEQNSSASSLLTSPLSASELQPISLPIFLSPSNPQANPPEPVVLDNSTSYSVEVITGVAEINARFKAAIEQANITPSPPELSLPNNVSSLLYSSKKNKLRGEWDRLKNKYEHAKKVKELSRLNQLVVEYKKLANEYPELSSAAKFNIGCLYFELNQLTEAVKAFEEAAANSSQPQTFYNLAVASLQKEDKAKACYALQEFFKQTSIEQNISAWYKYLGLAIGLGAVDILTDLLKQKLRQHQIDDAQLILNSVVFVLKANYQEENAQKLMQFILENSPYFEQAPALVNSMLSRLNIEPNEKYLGQQQVLQNAQEQAQIQKEQAKRQKEVEKILSYAQELARKHQYGQAISEIRKVLRVDPEHNLAKNLETKYRDADKERGLPVGSGPYAQAKRAHIMDQDLRTAKELYHKAIKQKDRLESAVNDLASIYLQERQDNKAIELLTKYRDNVSNKQAILNLLATAYQRKGKYQEEISCLKDVLVFTPYHKQPIVLKRIAIAQFNMLEYKQSKDTLSRVLRQNPNDQVARRLLDGLRKAEQTGIYTQVDALFKAQEGIADAETTLSDFLIFHIEQCDYAGVEASKVASKNFQERDAEKLDRLAEQLGIKRARERASYYLSAAKILMDLGVPAEERRPRAYLRNFCAAMGDACIAEKKHNDVARSYYAEAFVIAPDWVKQLEFKLSQCILLFYSTPDIILNPEIPSIESCLEKILDVQHLGKSVIEELLYLSWLNREVGRVLINKINLNKLLKELVQNLCYEILEEQSQPTTDQAAFFDLWERGRDLIRRRNQEVVNELNFLNSIAIGLDSLLDQIKKVQELGKKIRITLDKQRLNSIKEILGSMYDYSKQQSYTEREYYAKIIQNRITEVIKEVEKNPTQLSCGLFRPYLLSLQTTVNEHFLEIQQAAEPEELNTELSLNTLPNTANLECQITISNEDGKSPASAIKVQVLDSPNKEYQTLQKSISVTEALPGGESVTCQIPVSITELTQQSQVFTLYYQLSYTTRSGKTIETAHKESIQLYSATDFKEINNPYTSYAQGSIVEDEKMFYGRDQFIDNLISSIRNSPSAKSFVIYGQKRAGKSSILYHLEQKLELPIIPIRFSIGGSENLSEATFLYLIIQEIENAFEELADKGYPSIDVQRPTLEQLQDNAQLRFQDYMFEFRRKLKNIDEYRNARIMLLIDEFSYIYGQIMLGFVKRAFMPFWKALLERGYFGVVLVGQDYMPRFIESFPNDFQIAENKRVSYLEEEYARNLIVNPILTEKQESRYKGEAVNRLIQLTAGSPYYIQIFCNRLVNYMNRKKVIYVTDADIERVKEELISGHNSLDSAVFDNLTSAGDANTDNISKEDAEAVLRDIANGSRLQPYCDQSSVTPQTSVPVDDVLKDLEKREVIEKQGTSGFRIKVGLFKEWLLAHQ